MGFTPIGLKISGYLVIISEDYIKVDNQVVEIVGSTLVTKIRSIKFYLYKTSYYLNIKIIFNNEYLTLRLSRGTIC